MTKVLKAPMPWTGPITTSEGDVELVDGIARKYTKKVAEHLVENVPGWKYAVIEDSDEPEQKAQEPDSEASSDLPADDESKAGAAEAIDLPVMQDYAKDIRQFAKDHEITLPNSARSKKAMLSIIYEHFEKS